MRYVAVLIFSFVSSALCRADQPVQNTLTPAEIAEGWISLFDGKTTFGWKVTGDAKVDNGIFVLGGANGAKIESTCSFGVSIIQFEFQPTINSDELGLDLFFFRDLSVQKGFADPPKVSGKELGWSSNVWYSATIELGNFENNGKGWKCKIEAPGKKSEYIDRRPGVTSAASLSALVLSIAKNETVRLRNIKLKPTGLTPIFDGKSLAGWHEYKGPDAKSKFSVTPEGTLHIENGKGDLQTDKQWSDFLLQIECRTNAPALNSGVFFRCQPDKYQQGYEAQIQNSFFPAPTKEYVIDRYDPQTHKLLSKDKVKYDSLDYGTGSIYRRIPARFKAANDREWCTMTLLAEGRHMGVWVNGIMVTDWTDNRPDSDNGRNGFKAGPGNISLQGHDPTTNLDFRNIRIVDLSKK